MVRMRSTAFRAILLLLLLWGAFVRTWAVGDRAFWRDEAWVASLVTSASCGELMTQGEYPLPPLFSVTIKFLGRLLSPPELGLRLLPMLCGIANLGLILAILRTLRLPRTVILAAMALCASSLMLVIWSRELKQYQVEATFTLLLALAVLRLRLRTRLGRVDWRVALPAAICLLGPWFGYGFVFPAAVLLAVLIFLPTERGRRRLGCTAASCDGDERVVSRRPVCARRIGIAAGLLGSALLACTLVALLHVAAAGQAANPALVEHASHSFIEPLNLRDWLRATAYTGVASLMVLLPFEWTVDVAGAENIVWSVLLGLGLWLLAAVGLLLWPGRGRREMICWLVGPWLLMLVGALLRRYPFAEPRMMVFSAAPLAIAVAVGVVRLTRVASLIVLRRGSVGLIGGFILCLLPTVLAAGPPLLHAHWARADFRPVLQTLREQRRPGQIVYVTFKAVPCVAYYAKTDRDEMLMAPVAAGTLHEPGVSYTALEDEAIRRAGSRWWIVTSCERGDGEPEALLKKLARNGYRAELVAEGGPSPVYPTARLYRVAQGLDKRF